MKRSSDGCSTRDARGLVIQQDKMARSAATELHGHETEDPPESPQNLGVEIVHVVLGQIGLTGEACLLNDEATSIAHDIGVPELIIGPTMIALGTSLPELLRLSSPSRYRGRQCPWQQSV